MKKFFAVALVAMMAMTANAQVYVGGTVGFKSLSCDGTSATSFTINPELGYNLNENWAIGLSVGRSKILTTWRLYDQKRSNCLLSADF